MMSKPTYSSGKRKEKKAISWETADPAQGTMLSDAAFRELQPPLHLSNPGLGRQATYFSHLIWTGTWGWDLRSLPLLLSTLPCASLTLLFLLLISHQHRAGASGRFFINKLSVGRSQIPRAEGNLQAEADKHSEKWSHFLWSLCFLGKLRFGRTYLSPKNFPRTSPCFSRDSFSC